MRLESSTPYSLLWMLAIAALFAASQAQPDEKTSSPDDPEINWLFVVNATGGTFDGKTLTMRDVPPPLFFSDRPYRVWGHMTLPELLPMVEEGPDSFIVNPPNAVLSTFREGETPTEATVVMHRPTLNGPHVSFEVDVLEGHIPATFGPASLFVDRVHHAAGAFIVGAAVANSANRNNTETVVVKEPTYVYHTDPVPAAPAPASAQSRLAEAKSLFDQGLISEDEYAGKREEILASM